MNDQIPIQKVIDAKIALAVLKQPHWKEWSERNTDAIRLLENIANS